MKNKEAILTITEDDKGQINIHVDFGKDVKEKVIKAWNTRVATCNDPHCYDTLRDRDRYHDVADELAAAAIAKYFGVDI